MFGSLVGASERSFIATLRETAPELFSYTTQLSVYDCNGHIINELRSWKHRIHENKKLIHTSDAILDPFEYIASVSLIICASSDSILKKS